jgi:hypothetical protein
MVACYDTCGAGYWHIVARRAVDPADGLIADVVGPWASEKHERLKKYIDAYRSARAQFLPPRGSGGAAYVELFSGPGRSQLEDTGEFIDGSPLVAFHHWLDLIRSLDKSPAEGIELVSATRGQRLYWLVFVSAHELGLKLWNDIRQVGGQGRLI